MGCRYWDEGYGMQNARIQDLSLGVRCRWWDRGYRMQGWRILDVGCRMQDKGNDKWDMRIGMQDVGVGIWNVGYGMLPAAGCVLVVTAP